MHNCVTVSDEISLICTVLYTEVLKNHLITNYYSTWQVEYSIDPDNSAPTNSNCFSFPCRVLVTRVLLYPSGELFFQNLGFVIFQLNFTSQTDSFFEQL